MDGAGDRARAVHDKERGDLVLLHEREGRGGQLVRRDGLGVEGHALGGGQREDVPPPLQQPPKVAVGDDPLQAPGVVHHGGDAHPPVGHGVNGVLQGRVEAHPRHGVTGAHQVGDPEQPLSDLATRVEQGEVLQLEPFPDAQGHRERVAHGQRRGCAGSGRQAKVAGLAGDAGVEAEVGRPAQGRVGVAGQHHQRQRQPLDVLEEAEDLRGFAGVGEGHDHVARGQHAQVAVDGLGGVQKEGRGAGAGERGGHLPGDDAALAHARGDDAPLAVLERVQRAQEALVQLGLQAADGLRLGAQDLAGDVKAHGAPPRGRPRGSPAAAG